MIATYHPIAKANILGLMGLVVCKDQHCVTRVVRVVACEVQDCISKVVVLVTTCFFGGSFATFKV